MQLILRLATRNNISKFWLAGAQPAAHRDSSAWWSAVSRPGASSCPAFHRFGNRVRYRRADLDAWAARRRATTTAEADRLPSGARGGA